VDRLMKEFRDRVLIPMLVPLGALAIIVVVVLNVSRVLLALEERSGPAIATVLAILLASGILFGFAYFSARGEERSPASVSLMSVAGITVILAGFFGAEAIHEDEQEKAAKAKEAAEASKPDLIVHAFDIGFREKELKIGPGKARIEMVNEGAIAHTFVLEGVTGGKKLSTPSGGAKDSAAFDVQPGTFTYFCDIPGHRQGGMEGKLIVDPSAPPPGSGGAGGAAAGAVNIEAGDLFFNPKDVTAPPGPVTINLTNKGQLQHNLVVEEDPGFKKIDVAPGASGSGTFEAKPGTYTLYCDIAGHRPAGMEAKLTVGSSAPAPASGGGGGGAAAASPTTTAPAPAAAPASGGGGGGAAAGTIEIEGGDLFFKPKEVTAPAGPVTIKLTNTGKLPHNLVIQEDPGFKKIDLAPGASGSGTFEAKPGTYTLFCDIAGHRQAGMEAKLTVS
jgi:plastocyanin